MRHLAIAATMTILLTACGSSDSTQTDEAADAVESGEQAEAVESVDESVPVATDQPAIAPGGFTTGQVTIDGTAIDYVTVTPAGFQIGDTAPVLFAMPPGGQNLALTESVVASVYANEAIARGWVVISPAAPDSELYFNGSEIFIPGLLGWLETWVDAEGGKPHLAGISNGGLSSFRVAAMQPEAFSSIVAFPGYARSDDDKAALEQLTDIPVRLYVGETDSGWVGPMQETFDTLTELGGDVTLDIRAGEGHVMASLSDGVDVFDQLDAAR